MFWFWSLNSFSFNCKMLVNYGFMCLSNSSWKRILRCRWRLMSNNGIYRWQRYGCWQVSRDSSLGLTKCSECYIYHFTYRYILSLQSDLLVVKKKNKRYSPIYFQKVCMEILFSTSEGLNIKYEVNMFELDNWDNRKI